MVTPMGRQVVRLRCGWGTEGACRLTALCHLTDSRTRTSSEDVDTLTRHISSSRPCLWSGEWEEKN